MFKASRLTAAVQRQSVAMRLIFPTSEQAETMILYPRLPVVNTMLSERCMVLSAVLQMESHIPVFQDYLRQDYPLFSTTQQQEVNVGPAGVSVNSSTG